MNIVDLFLLLALFISVIFAIYRGAIASLLGLAATLLSFALAFSLGPRIAAWLGTNRGLSSLLATYTDAGALVGDSSLAATPVAGISATALEAVLKSVSLPDALESILRSNLQNAAFSAAGLITVNEYVTATVVSAALQASGFVLAFLLAFISLHILINLITHVPELPVLKHFDWLAAVVFGLLRGMLLLYVLFLLMPLIRAVIPLELLDRYLGQSALSALFASDGFFIRVVTGG